jgi:hypothetical protein
MILGSKTPTKFISGKSYDLTEILAVWYDNDDVDDVDDNDGDDDDYDDVDVVDDVDDVNNDKGVHYTLIALFWREKKTEDLPLDISIKTHWFLFVLMLRAILTEQEVLK